MGFLKDSLVLRNSNGEEIDIDILLNKYKNDTKRVLINDEIGVVLYTADLDIFTLDVTPSGYLVPKKVNQIKRTRFGTSIIRLQIGSKVASYTADTIFRVKKDDYIIKIRADKIKKGMVLESGEKVY